MKRLATTLLLLLALIAAPARAADGDPGPLHIVAFGDSTTAPFPSVRAVYPDRLAEALAARGIAAAVTNAGVSGDTTGRARARFQADVLDRRPDLVVIQFGLNDATIDRTRGATKPRLARDLYEANLIHFIAALRRQGALVVLMTPIPPVRTDRLLRWRRAPVDPESRWCFDRELLPYVDTVRRLAEQHRVPLVDVHRAVHRLDMSGERADALLADGLHPNDEGHALITEHLADGIDAMDLGRRRRPIRGYTIPVVDISGERHRQVVVDREPGRYLGHPTTVLLEDGRTMIAVYPKGHGRGAIVMKRSDDGGLTWSPRLPVPDNWATSKETPTIHRVVDPRDGSKRLILFSGLNPCRMAVSEDDGTTWTPLQPVGDWGGIVTMSSVVPLADGRLLAMFHDDGRFITPGGRRSEAMTLYQSRSGDGGLTWSAPETIHGAEDVHLCEPGVVRSPDGRRLAALLRENRRARNAHVIFSDDEGATWSAPRELPGALTGDRHTARYAPDGRLFISFRDTSLESPTKGDWVGWVGTWDDLASGRQGQYRVRIMDNHRTADCAYPGVEVLPDGTIVTTTYGHWTEGEPPYIVSVRFTLSELDAGAGTGAGAAGDPGRRPPG